MKRAAALAGLALAVVLLLPVTAQAATTHTRAVEVLGGAEIVSRIAAQIRHVSLSSTGATVTVGAAGHSRPVHIDYAGIAKELERDPRGAGLMQLAVIPILGGAFLRFLVFLARLGGR